MRQPLYLGLDEEVVAILGKIKKTPAEDIVLVVPRGARILSSSTALKLLLEQSGKLGKKIAIATADERGKAAIQKAGIAIVTPTASLLSSSATRAARRHQTMGDIRRPTRRPLRKKTVPEKSRSQTDASVNLTSLIAPPDGVHEPIRMPEPVRYRRIKLKYVAVAAGLLLAIGALLVFYVLPRAEVVLTARTEPITRDLEVQVDSSKGVPDVQNLSIPGKKVSEELTEAKTYPATGVKNVGEKASGFVTIYNFSKSSLILKSATTRLEVKGKTYRFLQDVGSIRPTARIGPDLEIDQTSLIEPVAIVAADSGEQFNLPVGTRFEIHNEVFGHQPNVLYAVNANPIAGGTTKQVKVVTVGDIETARKELTKALAQKLEGTLQSKLSITSRLAENSYRSQVLEEQISKPIGSEAEQFELKQKVRMTVLTYNQDDVRDLIVQRTVRLLPENKVLAPGQNDDVTAQFVSLDLNAGVGTLRAHFESEIRYQINPLYLTRSLLGKTPSQVKEILLARPEVQDVQVQLSPFWVSKVPIFSSKLHIKVKQ